MTNTKHGNKTILERLIEELGMNDKQLQIEYLLLRLVHREDKRIGKTNSFWQRLGFTIADDPQMISLIKKHPLLMAKTVYKGETVLERLVDELRVKALIYGDKTLQIEYLLH
eukprot:1094171_1